jgi:TPR repeat protein
MRNHYRILGIRSDATREEIKDAWNFSVKAFHPDKFATSSARQQTIAQERTKAINEAYEVLFNPVKRANYDWQYAKERSTHAAAPPPPPPPRPQPPPPPTAQRPAHTTSGRERTRPTPPRKPAFNFRPTVEFLKNCVRRFKKGIANLTRKLSKGVLGTATFFASLMAKMSKATAEVFRWFYGKRLLAGGMILLLVGVGLGTALSSSQPPLLAKIHRLFTTVASSSSTTFTRLWHSTGKGNVPSSSLTKPNALTESDSTPGPSAGAAYELANQRLNGVQTPPPDESSAPDALVEASPHKDLGGSPEGPLMGISEVKTTETSDPEAETNLALEIGIKKQPGAVIDRNKVRILAFLYDVVNDKDIELTNANVSNEWLTKHDWSGTNPEVLLVRYGRVKNGGALSESALSAPAAKVRPGQTGRGSKGFSDSGQRKYLGYIVRVLYGDDLQAVQADPARLLQQFPLYKRPTVADSRSKFEQSQQAFRQRDFATALKLVKEADKAGPNQPVTLNLRGEILMQQGQFDNAEAAFKKAAKLDPKLRDAQYNLAQIPFKKKEYAKARDRFETLYKRIPGGEKNQAAELIKFKIYMALLMDGKESRAHSMMEEFQFTGDTPALYYAQAAWEYKHNNAQKAEEWTNSANKVYSPALNGVFADAFYDVGWLQRPEITRSEDGGKGTSHSQALEALARNDYKLVIPRVQKSADEGSAIGQTYLAWMYHNGKGVPQDYAKAVALYQKAADQGYAPAQSRLAFLLLNGEGVPKDYEKALTLLEKAAAQGDAGAQVNLAAAYAQGKGVPQDYKRALELYQKAADQGNAIAQNNLGWLYQSGQGVPKDLRKATELYQKAADQGNAPAQTSLAGLYQYGEGVPKDLGKAAELLTKAGEVYQKAADQGDAFAQNNLGWLYQSGQGVPKDLAKAAELYQKAADQGYAPAQVNLGWLYHEGKGVPQDYRKAVELYQIAADQGYPVGQAYLASAYVDGKGVSRDYRKGLDLFHKALDQRPHPNVLNDFAWFLATCPDAAQRNGKQAVEYATKACELTEWKSANLIGTLAAAYAETEDFDTALKYQKQAMDIPDSDYPSREEMARSIELYRQRKPYREQ